MRFVEVHRCEEVRLQFVNSECAPYCGVPKQIKYREQMRENKNYENAAAGHDGAGAAGMAMPRTPSEQTELFFEATAQDIKSLEFNRITRL